MNCTQGAFEKDHPNASKTSSSQSGYGDEDTNALSQPLQNIQVTTSASMGSASATHGSCPTEKTLHTSPYEPFVRNTSQTFEPPDTTWRAEQLPQYNMDAPGWDRYPIQPTEPSTTHFGTYAYPLPAPEQQNDAFFGFSDTQQQPNLWPQQDFTLGSTPYISPQDLSLQPEQDYFQSPPSQSSETITAFSDNKWSTPQSSSTSSTCTGPPIPTKPDTASLTKPSKGTRPTHNMVEKQYRTRLNAHFDDLLAKIPKEYLLGGSDLGIDRKNTSKTETLVMAEHYIKTLEKDATKLSAENKELLHHFETLKAEWTRNGGVILS